jgi:pimeloyl-ACP methyl ester carboxylesterase
VEARVLEHDEAGCGEPPFVLLPGGLTGWQSWLPLVPALSELRRTVRVQPIVNAEGLAGRVGDDSVDAAVERESLVRTLAAAGVEDMHLVGWSNGGRIALDFAIAFPGRIRTLTLVEPAAWWLADDAGGREFGEFVRSRAGRECSEEDVRQFLIRDGVASAETDFAALPQWSFWASCRQTLSWYGERTVRSAAAGIEGFERLEVPTLVIRGDRTAPWLAAAAEAVGTGLPDAVVVELEGGHACLLESASDFLAALGEHAR